MKEATRIVRSGGQLGVKWCDYVESGHKRWLHDHVCDVGKTLGLTKLDEFVHLSGTGAQPKTNRDGSPRRQVHARRSHSFLVIFRT